MADMSKPASALSVVTLTLGGLVIALFGAGYAYSCDRNARNNNTFDASCFITGLTIALGGSGTAAGTWLKNPYLRPEEREAQPPEDAEAELLDPPEPPEDDPQKEQLEQVLAELQELRSRLGHVPDRDPETGRFTKHND